MYVYRSTTALRTFFVELSKNIILLVLVFGLTKCKYHETDFVFDEFKSQIVKQGLKIDSVDKTGLIYISIGESTVKVSLDNVRKDYKRDNDKTHISDLVETLTSYSIEIPSNWNDAKDSIYISLFPNDYDFDIFLNHKVTTEFSKIYVHSGHDKLTWISKDDLKKWNISEADLEKQANLNADKLLANTEISLDTIENRKLGLINAEHETRQGALLFAPSMKDKIEKDFGFPFYAVIPVRDLCYIFSRADFDFFSKYLGSLVVKEYKNSGYPVTTEILKFTDKGVEPVGHYPTK